MSDTETPPTEPGGDTAPAPKNKGGRPRNPNPPDPTRSAGRHGKIWDDCVVQAANDGQTMTDFVREAITRELARRQRLARTEKANAALTPEQRYPHAVADCGDNTLAHAPHVGCRGTLPGTAPAEPAPPGLILPPEVADRLRVEGTPRAEASNPRDPGAAHWVRERAPRPDMRIDPRPVPRCIEPCRDPEHCDVHAPAAPAAPDLIPVSAETARTAYDVEQQGDATSPGYDTDGEGNPVEDDDPPAFPAAMVEAFERQNAMARAIECGADPVDAQAEYDQDDMNTRPAGADQ